MTIGKRLLLLLAVPLIALIGFGVFARIQLSQIENAADSSRGASPIGC